MPCQSVMYLIKLTCYLFRSEYERVQLGRCRRLDLIKGLHLESCSLRLDRLFLYTLLTEQGVSDTTEKKYRDDALMIDGELYGRFGDLLSDDQPESRRPPHPCPKAWRRSLTYRRAVKRSSLLESL